MEQFFTSYQNLVTLVWTVGMFVGLGLGAFVATANHQEDTKFRHFIVDLCIYVTMGALLGPIFVAFCLGYNYAKRGSIWHIPRFS